MHIIPTEYRLLLKILSLKATMESNDESEAINDAGDTIAKANEMKKKNIGWRDSVTRVMPMLSIHQYVVAATLISAIQGSHRVS